MALSGCREVAWVDLMIGVAICVGAGCDDMPIDLGGEAEPHETTPFEPEPEPEPETPIDEPGYVPDRTRGLRIELLWRSEGAIDVGDGGVIGEEVIGGADLDLHFVHSFVHLANPDGLDFDDDGEVDGWFDPTFDAHFDGHPLWGTASRADDPVLAPDDVNGEGPETLWLEQPEARACYYVGVHVWNAYQFGASAASIHVYWDDEEIFSTKEVTLYNGYLWDVVTVCTDDVSVTVTPSGCKPDASCRPKIMVAYPVPKDYRRPVY